MDTTFIYALCEPGTRTVRYIGMSIKPKRRFRDHVTVSCRKTTHLGRWLNRLVSSGVEPEMVVLSTVPREEGPAEEIRYITNARMLGMDLVNSNDGGEGGANPTPEVREKMRRNNLGENNNMFGKRVSQEVRSRIAASQKGTKNHRFGKTFTSEQKALRGALQSGKNNPMFGRSGELAPAFRREVSEETRQKLSKINKGKVLSEETKAKISKAALGRPSPTKGRPSKLKGRTWPPSRRATEEKKKQLRQEGLQ